MRRISGVITAPAEAGYQLPQASLQEQALGPNTFCNCATASRLI